MKLSLSDLYNQHQANDIQSKIDLLMRLLDVKSLHFFGNGETEEEKLTALEFVYNLENKSK